VTLVPLAERLRAQLLVGPRATDPVAVAERLLAIQAQDLTGARLAVRARSSALTAADVDRALTADRSLVVTWLNRGTLHLARSEDYRWLHALTAPQQLTRTHRRLAEEGVSEQDAERAARLIERALADEGLLTRRALRERLEAAGVPVRGQALPHLLGLTALRGTTVRAPVVDGEQAHVLVHDWLGPAEPVDRERALGELARRYLAGHGPADDRDLARWAGIPLGQSRAGLNAIASQIVQREDGLLALRGHDPPSELPPPRLLGPFEPLLLGWVSREPIVGARRDLVTVNGVFKPFLLVGGRAAGTWRRPAGDILVEPFEPLPAPVEEALRRDAEDVRRYLG
jgi:hypothetical protein